MIKRIRRRVRHSDEVPAAQKSMTFDRTHFSECSQRMKRFVPTLNRPKANTDFGKGNGSSHLQKEKDSKKVKTGKSSAHSFSSQTKSVPLVSIQEPAFEVQSIDNDLEAISADHGEPSEEGTSETGKRDSMADLTAILKGSSSSSMSLTMPMEAMGASGEPATATLPAKLEGTQHGLESCSVRRLWLKPFTQFASLMSTIGDNLDIVAYPTP